MKFMEWMLFAVGGYCLSVTLFATLLASGVIPLHPVLVWAFTIIITLVFPVFGIYKAFTKICEEIKNEGKINEKV